MPITNNILGERRILFFSAAGVYAYSVGGKRIFTDRRYGLARNYLLCGSSVDGGRCEHAGGRMRGAGLRIGSSGVWLLSRPLMVCGSLVRPVQLEKRGTIQRGTNYRGTLSHKLESSTILRKLG